jgi:phytoene dehydrogenase-like protein
MSNRRPEADVIIVGAGLAGLACAKHVYEHQASVQIVEASDDIGGRVRTDKVDGFLLDRGFQVLLTAYPEARRVLNFDALRLHKFLPGAMIHSSGQVHKIADPFREPLIALESLLAPVGTTGDKLRLLTLRQQLRRAPLDSIFAKREQTTIEALRSRKFSPTVITNFFRPFLGGVFLEKELRTSSRSFEFIYKMFSLGYAALPAEGMGAIPAQLAAALPKGSFRFNARAMQVDKNRVKLEGGEELSARAIVIATDGPEAARLHPELKAPGSYGVTCLYFSAPKDPVGSPVLFLNGDGSGLINNLCVPSTVAPSYAPVGSSLVSATVLGTEEEDATRLLSIVRAQLASWFGAQAQSWKHLRTYRIFHGLPSQNVPSYTGTAASQRTSDGVYVCGDHFGNASIEGALLSGRRAGEEIIRDIH